MEIGFIGAGKAGYSLGKYFKENRLSVLGYYSKKKESAAEAADFTNSIHFKKLEEIIAKSDILFITTPDGVIADIWNEIRQLLTTKNKILCHCSGYLSSAVFSGIEELDCYGCSAHPIFVMNSKKESYMGLSKAFFTVEGDAPAVSCISKLLENLGNPVKVISAEKKAIYHGAASMASNSVIALLQIAVELLGSCGFTEQETVKAIFPLAMDNMTNVCNQGIQGALTGPVERFDGNTVLGHMNGMTGTHRQIYILLAQKLLEIAEKKHPEKRNESAVLRKILTIEEKEQ